MSAFLNWPNRLTILRILMIPVFVICLIYGHKGWALALFSLAGVTDAMDGVIARAWNQKTEIGTFLDPMADKLLLTTSFITLAVMGQISVWLTVLVISRDIIIVSGSSIIYIINGSLKISPTLIGKLTTLFQLITIFITLVKGIYTIPAALIEVLVWGTAAVTVASGLHYVYIGNTLINQQKPSTGS